MIPLSTPAEADESGERILRIKMPAWLLSLVLHAAALVVGAFLLRGGVLPNPPEPAPREVGIVLADAAATGDVEYFAEEDAAAESTAGGDPSRDAADASPEGGPRRPGPPLPEPSIVPPDALVGDLPLIGGEGVAGVPQLRVAGRPQILPGLGEAEILAEEAARRKATGPRGPAATMSLFGGAPAVGNSFVFLIDRSQSMGGDGLNALAAAEQELNRQLAKLESAHKFQIIAYNQQILRLSEGGLLPVTPEQRTKAARFLGGLVAFAGTQHEMALMAGLRLEPDVLFLLTDGGDPLITPAEIARVTERNGRRTSIHCIHFGSGPEGESGRTLRELVRRNGGSYGYVDMRGK